MSEKESSMQYLCKIWHKMIWEHIIYGEVLRFLMLLFGIVMPAIELYLLPDEEVRGNNFYNLMKKSACPMIC